MRVLLISLFVYLGAAQAFGYTFVLKSGKRIQGRILFEEQSILRIEDHTGVPMILKKSTLDWNAMAQANRPEPPKPAPVVEKPAPNRSARSVHVYRNVPQPETHRTSVPRTEKEWKERLRGAEKDYFRYKDACRNAGTGPEVKKRLESHVYYVNGKKVTVTGYWAHPDSIRAANAICQKAVRAELDLAEARQVLEQLESNTTHSAAGSTGAGSSAANRR